MIRLIGSSRFYPIKIIVDRENMVQAEWPDNLTDRHEPKYTHTEKKQIQLNDEIYFSPNCLLKTNYGENDMIIS